MVLELPFLRLGRDPFRVRFPEMVLGGRPPPGMERGGLDRYGLADSPLPWVRWDKSPRTAFRLSCEGDGGTAGGVGGGGGSGGGGAGRGKAAEFNISEARKAVEEGDVAGALGYLEAMIRGHRGKRDDDSARRCLEEGRRIAEEADDPRHFQWELRFAAHYHQLGGSGEAEALFERVLRYLPRSEPHRHNEIRSAVAITYGAIGIAEKARAVAHGVEGQTAKFVVFRDLVKTLRGGGVVVDDSLMEEWVAVVRTQGGRVARAEQLIVVAEALVEMERREAARSILDELVGPDPGVHLSNLREEDDPILVRACILLRGLGEQARAVEALTRGWLREEGMSDEEIRRLRLELIGDRYPGFLAVGKEGDHGA